MMRTRRMVVRELRQRLRVCWITPSLAAGSPPAAAACAVSAPNMRDASSSAVDPRDLRTEEEEAWTTKSW